MQWKWEPKEKPQKDIPNVGDKKRVSKFLFFPMSINKETRWFERAIVWYEYKVYANEYVGFSYYINKCGWVPIRWGKDYKIK